LPPDDDLVYLNSRQYSRLVDENVPVLHVNRGRQFSQRCGPLFNEASKETGHFSGHSLLFREELNTQRDTDETNQGEREKLRENGGSDERYRILQKCASAGGPMYYTGPRYEKHPIGA